MNALLQEIEVSIRSSVHNYIKIVSDKYNIDVDELVELWEKSENNFKSRPKQVLSKPKTSPGSSRIDSDIMLETFSEEENIESLPKVISKAAPDGCPYIYTKGEKEGQTCGIKAKGGVIYCTRHKKYEGQEPKQKKIIPSAKKSIAGNTQTKVTPPQAKEVNTVLRKNKAIDKLWHSPTGMVFKSAKERVVIGKCVNDKILPLEKEDINICMSHSFAYDVSWEEEEEEEAIPVVTKQQPIENKKVQVKETPKKSISEAITEANIKASDIDLILCELQIGKALDDDEPEEDLVDEDLEEEDE